jgi:methionyl aminopeptidase
MAKKMRRNDPCPCGSGLKYKKCCLGKSKIQHESVKNIYAQKYNIRLKEKQDIKSIQRAGRLVLKTIDLIETQIKAGITTDEINTLVHEFTIKNGATPAPLNYRGFPKSVCVSINEEICHGIPGERNLQDGDIVLPS